MTIGESSEMGNGFGIRHEGGYIPQGAATLASPLAVKASKQGRVPSCRIYPNGEFGLGYKFPREESLTPSVNQAGGVSCGHMRAIASSVALESRLARQVSRILTEDSKPSQVKRYGLKGITNYGKKMVRNAGHLLQRRYHRSRLCFLTLTVPPMTVEGARSVAQNWGEVMRQLMQWISRKLERAELPKECVLVSEVQPQRAANGNLESLHVHGVFPAKKRGKDWAIHYSEIRAFWCELLSRVSGETVQSDAVEQMKTVKKSAENYLSKYMSKGVKEIELLIEMGGVECVPKQWWNMTNELRKSIKQSVLSGENISTILELLVKQHYKDEAPGAFKFCRIIEREITEYQSVVVGYFGRLNGETLKDLTELCQGLKSA